MAFAGLAAFGLLPALAQGFSFTQVRVEGNERIEAATILSFAGIESGEAVSSAELNDASQRIRESGLFETVEIAPQGNTLVIRVSEYPSINRIAFEGNRRLSDEDLSALVKSQSRRVYSPAQAEQDAAAISEAYSQSGRLAAAVTPRIIRRSNNRVDLVFEVREGRVTEIERLSFTGNRAFTDRRLRQVLETKQAGFLRQLIQRDTFVPDRLEFDKQVLTDFYRSRGYIDFQVLGTASEFSRERDAFFLTISVQEGQSWKFGNITTVSEMPEANAAEFQAENRIRSGVTYSPNAVDNTIARMEALALRKGINFLRVEPRLVRNPRNLTLDVEFALTRGERIFVERIDIEGNQTTLDRVLRRQFRTVEGDPFNPREIREAAERTRALGFFSDAQVNATPGSSPDQVIVDVNVEEQPTGTLSFGISYGVSAGAGFNVGFQESNFLGRGQTFNVSLSTGTDSSSNSITFIEPAFLGRDLRFRFQAYYNTSNDDNSNYSTRLIGISPALEFPVSELGRLEVRYKISSDDIFDVGTFDDGGTPDDPSDDGYVGSSPILTAEEGRLLSSGVGYTYSYDTRLTGLNPNAGVLLRFGQDYAGLGGDVESITTNALVSAETKAFREEVTLRAELEGGAVHMLNGNSRLTDRFFGRGKIRGFEPNGLGPRDLGAANEDALGGNLFAVARFEAEFPLGLPEEYGVTGGLFLDVGSVWSLDNVAGATGPVDDSLNLRSAVGFSVFWTTPIGPLRFNFSKAIQKEDYDKEQSFDLTISTRF